MNPRINIHIAGLVLIFVLFFMLMFYKVPHTLDTQRLANRIEHVMDIVQDLQEISQNIHVKDAMDNFSQDSIGKEPLFNVDLIAIGAILEAKCQQMYSTLHQVLCQLKSNGHAL